MGTDQETVEKPAEKTMEAKNDSIRQEYAFASDVKLKECKYCRVMIPRKAKICPNCKMMLKSHMALKTIAAILVLAVVVAGSYCLSAYWGLLPESAVPAWMAQNMTPAPVVSVNTVETAEAAAGAKAVEPTEVATAAVTVEFEQAAPVVEPVETEKSASNEEEQKEEAEPAAESDSVKDEDAAEDESVEEDKTDLSGEAPAFVLEDVDENEAAFRADCVRRKYKSLLRDEQYLETAVLVMEAEVVCQVDGGLFDENVYYLCREKENDIDCYYIIRDDRNEDETLILEGDIITVYGRLFGICKIPANLIETRPTVPAISMVTYDLLEE